MTQEQENLLVGARDSLSAAKLLHREGYHGFAASRAYYAMFYVAEALYSRFEHEIGKPKESAEENWRS